VLFLGPTNAGATIQSVLGVTIMLRKFVLVPFDSHKTFLPVLNSFQLQKDSTYLKAVQHRQKDSVTIQGDKHKLAQHNWTLSFCSFLCKVDCSRVLVWAPSDCEPPCLAVE